MWKACGKCGRRRRYSIRGRWVGVVGVVGVEGVLGGKGIVEVGKRDSTEGGEPSSGPKDETIRIQNLVHRIVHV